MPSAAPHAAAPLTAAPPIALLPIGTVLSVHSNSKTVVPMPSNNYPPGMGPPLRSALPPLAPLPPPFESLVFLDRPAAPVAPAATAAPAAPTPLVTPATPAAPSTASGGALIEESAADNLQMQQLLAQTLEEMTGEEAMGMLAMNL